MRTGPRPVAPHRRLKASVAQEINATSQDNKDHAQPSAADHVVPLHAPANDIPVATHETNGGVELPQHTAHDKGHGIVFGGEVDSDSDSDTDTNQSDSSDSSDSSDTSDSPAPKTPEVTVKGSESKSLIASGLDVCRQN